MENVQPEASCSKPQDNPVNTAICLSSQRVCLGKNYSVYLESLTVKWLTNIVPKKKTGIAFANFEVTLLTWARRETFDLI